MAEKSRQKPCAEPPQAAAKKGQRKAGIVAGKRH